MSKIIPLRHKILNAIAMSVNSSANITLNDAINITKACNILFLKMQLDMLREHGKKTSTVALVIEDLEYQYNKAIQDYELELESSDAEERIFEKSDITTE